MKRSVMAVVISAMVFAAFAATVTSCTWMEDLLETEPKKSEEPEIPMDEVMNIGELLAGDFAGDTVWVRGFIVGGLTSDGRIGLFATPGTVASGSYDIEIAKLYPSFRLYSHACPSWVEIVEAGKADSDIADEAVKTDVEALFAIEPTIDTIILGCTHYPLLLDKVEEHVAGRAKVDTQGQLVAESLADYLRRHPEIAERCRRDGDVEFLTTGPAERFDENASLFLGHEVAAKHCEF